MENERYPLIGENSLSNMVSLIVRITRSPFYRRERDANGRWIGIPDRIEKREIRAKLTREQEIQIWDARYFIERNMKSWLYGLSKRGKLTHKDYELIRHFVRAFIFTPRTEGGREIYRAPTMNELMGCFPQLKEATASSRPSGSRRKNYDKYYPKT